jgi:hypothetical protein
VLALLPCELLTLTSHLLLAANRPEHLVVRKSGVGRAWAPNKTALAPNKTSMR